MDIDRQIRDLIEQLNLNIIYCEDMDKKGYYIENTNIIAIKQGLSYTDEILVLLHEIGHAAKHKGESKIYNLTFALHSKYENEAETYMFEKLIPYYLSQVDKEYINWLHFMEIYKIDMKYQYVVQNLLKYYADSSQFVSFIN